MAVIQEVHRPAAAVQAEAVQPAPVVINKLTDKCRQD